MFKLKRDPASSYFQITDSELYKFTFLCPLNLGTSHSHTIFQKTYGLILPPPHMNTLNEMPQRDQLYNIPLTYPGLPQKTMRGGSKE